MTDFQENEIERIIKETLEYISEHGLSQYQIESAKLTAFDEIAEVLE